MIRSLLVSVLVVGGLFLVFVADAGYGADNAFCFEEAGNFYGISPVILWAISKVESGFNNSAVNYNTDGSYDYCHMQINSSWYRLLGKESWNALADPCFCTKVGAWVLSQCIARYGYTWEAVGCYNARSRGKRVIYANKVYEVIRRYIVK